MTNEKQVSELRVHTDGIEALDSAGNSLGVLSKGSQQGSVEAMRQAFARAQAVDRPTYTPTMSALEDVRRNTMHDRELLTAIENLTAAVTELTAALRDRNEATQ